MISKQVSLKPFNTFGIEVFASEFGVFNSVDSLKTLLGERDKSLPLLILGGGSNILFTKSVEATVLKNELLGMEVVKETESSVDVKAGAGVVWNDLVMFAVGKGWGGIENLSLIPGSVGASPMQNIGAYGVEIKDVFVSLEALHLETSEIRVFDKESCKFGYRESVFKRELKDQYIILSVTYRLSKSPKLNTGYGAIQTELEAQNLVPSVQSISQAVVSIRTSKLPDPKKLGNAGSFFKNPVVSKEVFEAVKQRFPNAPNYPQENGEVKLAAGWLIEQAGWKGKKIGNCGVHEKQALVLVNHGGASGQEIYNLSTKIIESIEQAFNVTLEREVNIW